MDSSVVIALVKSDKTCNVFLSSIVFVDDCRYLLASVKAPNLKDQANKWRGPISPYTIFALQLFLMWD